MTKEHAELEANELNQWLPTVFCPLLRSNCNPFCVCWEKAYVSSSALNPDSFKVKGFRCTNAMFFSKDELY